MAIYTELQISVTDNAQKEIVMAQLIEAGAEGFEEERGMLKVFVPSLNFNEIYINEIVEQNGLTYSKSIIEDRNWNAEWEANFEPVVVDNFCAIRADFHNPIAGIKHDIVITPKMSFGTGHHATTFMMIQIMAKITFENKTVFDFGTGTGVLAILADKLGAASTIAIDNDDWSIENAKENIEKNNCHNIVLSKADQVTSSRSFDIILANINRNIILAQMSHIKQHLLHTGVVLFSGLLIDDEPIIVQEARSNNLKLKRKIEKNGWICLEMIMD